MLSYDGISKNYSLMNQQENAKYFFERNSNYIELPKNSGIRLIGENKANKEIQEKLEVYNNNNI